MKLRAEAFAIGDIAHQGTDSGDKGVKSWDPVIRGDTFTQDVCASGLDLVEIEWQARVAQSAWIAHNVKAFGAALIRRLRSRSNVAPASNGLKALQNKAA